VVLLVPWVRLGRDHHPEREEGGELVARIRTIKPEFWKDQRTAKWPALSRLAYVALWNESDDEGRLRADPVYLRSTLFPYEPDLDMTEVLRPLIESKRLVIYEDEGETFGFLPKFRQHQTISNPSDSKLPPPPKAPPVTLQEDYRSPPVELLLGREGKGRERNREGKGESLAADAAPPLTEASELQAIWNQHSPPLPAWRELSKSRKVQALARLRERPLAEWAAVIERIAASSFCSGSNDRTWRADPDWLLKPGTAGKVLEGKYDDRKRATSNGARIPHDDGERQLTRAEASALQAKS
jgi:hypothetical protein